MYCRSCHFEFHIGTKNLRFVEDHTMNIPAKFGSNWPSGFGEEAGNVKSLQTTDANSPGELKRNRIVTPGSQSHVEIYAIQ